MKSFSLHCEKCGGSQLRRSRRQSLGEFAKIVQGQYPVRCDDCNHRFMANLLQFEKLPFARCPKCFSLDLTTSQSKAYHPTLWRTLMLSLGAHKYRCPACRYNFLSFRFQDPETMSHSDRGNRDSNNARPVGS